MGYMGITDFYNPAWETLGIFLIIYLAVLGACLLFSLISYILNAVGLYSVAKRRGIKHAWLSWLPLGNIWILGSISDQFQYIVKGKIRNRRKTLLGLNIATMLLTVPLEAVIVLLVQHVEKIAFYSTFETAQLLPVLVGFLGFVLVVFVISIVGTVHTYIAYYHLFFSCTPDDGVLFLVLGILFPVALPFFVFALRKKDNGMPPRKVQCAEESVL